jgi:hypothetical protein
MLSLPIGACDDDSRAPGGFFYTVRFDLEPTDDPLGALQFEVDYTGNEGEWTGAKSNVHCSWLVDPELHGCNDKGAGRMLCALVDTVGFSGPAPLLECVFRSASDDVNATDFEVDVVDASTPDLVPAVASIAVDVSPRAGITTSTSLEATSTTFATEPPAVEYGVLFEVGPTSGPIGALQIEVKYLGETGAWLGSHAGVACREFIDASLSACNDKGGGLLSCAFVDTSGFTGPTDLMECSFKSRDAVEAGLFNVEVVDASTPQLEPIDVHVVVSNVTPR